MKLISLVLMSLLSFSVFASATQMRNFLIANRGGSMYGGRVPDGYTSQKLAAAPMIANLKAYLSLKTREKESQWMKFVMTSGEYAHVSSAARSEIAQNPRKELGVKFLLEIEETYAIYKRGKLIGYYIQMTDHVQAAIYQDGAWINTFFTPELVLVQAFDESA